MSLFTGRFERFEIGLVGVVLGDFGSLSRVAHVLNLLLYVIVWVLLST